MNQKLKETIKYVIIFYLKQELVLIKLQNLNLFQYQEKKRRLFIYIRYKFVINKLIYFDNKT